MIIPNLLKERMVDEKGYLTPAWEQFHTQLLNQMNLYLSNEGVVIPKQSETNTTALLNGLDSENPPVGKMLYDTDNSNLKTNLNGVINTFSTFSAHLAAGTATGSAGDPAKCAAQKVLQTNVGGTQVFIPVFTQNTSP